MARSAKANKEIATLKRIENDKLVQQANERQYARLREDIDKKAESSCDFVTYHNHYFQIPFPNHSINPQDAYFFLKNHPKYVAKLERDGYAVEFNYQDDGELFDNVTVSWGDA